MNILLTLLVILLGAAPAWATNYYISPTGSNSNNGTSTSTPWLTFAYAFANMAGSPAGCGHTLFLMDGVYGDGTSTGTISLSGRNCAVGSELTIRALNSRQARVNDDGAGQAILFNSGTAGIIVDGLVFNSTTNSAETGSADGIPLYANNTDRITIKNSLCRNPNKYANVHCIYFVNSRDGLVEDTEIYDFHRHAITFFTSQRMVARRVYDHKRSGSIGAGGSPTVGSAGALVAMYPCTNCILENGIAEGGSPLNEMNATYNLNILMSGSKVLGSICLSCSDGNGIYANGRSGGDLNHTPQNITLAHNAFVGITTASEAIKLQDVVNTTVTRNTVIGTDSAGNGLAVSDQSGIGATAAQMSFTATSNIVVDRGGTGFLNSATTATYTGSNDNYAFSNGTSFNPSAATWGTGNVTTDPGLNQCKLWLPDGAAGAGKGAEILYRYENGTLTTTPLWDATTGEFPHGAIDIDGTNNTASTSLYNVHQRLNVPYSGDTHTCDFPSTYAGGTPPSNPAGLVTSQGTTSPSHARTVTASKEALVVGIALHDTAGSVGTVTGVTSSCGGGEALTQLATAVATNTSRRVYLFGRLNPTAGSCTVSATTTGTVTASVLLSHEYDDVAEFGTGVTASGLSATPSVTASVASDAGNIILDMLAAKCGVSSGACGTTLTAGESQTLLSDQGHLTLGDIRGAMSQQASTNGGVMSHTMGGSNYWAQVAVPMCAVSCSALTHVLTQSAGQVYSAFYVDGSRSALGAVNAANVNVPVGTSFAVCLQTDSTVAAVPEAGRKLYFSRNSGAYVAMADTATTGISFHGSTSDPAVIAGAVSTNLSGALTNVPGETIHSASVTPMATMTQDDSLVNCWVLKTTPTATENDTYEFREYTDAGVALDAYGATADAKVTVTGVTPDIDAPTNLTKVGTSATLVSLIWSPVTYATFAGYKVYQSTQSGVYDAPIAVITPSTAALLNTSPTQWQERTPVAGTYYFVVTAFDLNGNESDYSNEVTAVQAGMSTRGAAVTGGAASRSAAGDRALRETQDP